MIGVVLSFLQERLERRLSPSTLKVKCQLSRSITMQWTAGPWKSINSSWGSWGVPGGWIPLGHPWFPPGTSLSSWLDFRGVPLSRWTQSSWNSCRLRQRSWPRSLPSRGSGTSKNFSVSKECLVFGPAYSHVVLRPRPGYVPKVSTTPFRDQVVNLQALPSEKADPALAWLCPVRALSIYVDCTRSFRSSEQLFVCYGGQQKGKAVSKQRSRDVLSPCHNLEPSLVAWDLFSARQRKTWWVDAPVPLLYPYARGVAQVCKIH